MADLLTADMLAKLLRITPRRVRQLADEGIIPRVARGTYPFVGSVQGYISFLRDGSANVRPSEILQARTRLISAQADLAELALENQRVDLVRETAVEERWQAIKNRIAGQLDGLADRLTNTYWRSVGVHAPPAFAAEAQSLVHEAIAEIDGSGVPGIELQPNVGR